MSTTSGKMKFSPPSRTSAGKLLTVKSEAITSSDSHLNDGVNKSLVLGLAKFKPMTAASYVYLTDFS